MRPPPPGRRKRQTQIEISCSHFPSGFATMRVQGAGLTGGTVGKFIPIMKENLMSKVEKSVDNALAHVNKERRGFLKGMLIGSAALAVLPLMKSNALAQDQG